LKENSIDYPDDMIEGSPKRMSGLDNGWRYLPYA